jgi:hypothetical protein
MDWQKPNIKRLVAKTQIAANKQVAEERLIEMQSEPKYVYGYMIGFDMDNEYSVVGMYDYGNAPAGDHKEVFVCT